MKLRTLLSPRVSHPVHLFALLALAAATLRAADSRAAAGAGAGYEPSDITALFPAAGTATTLTFRAPPGGGTDGATPHAYLIKNYDGHVLAEGRATVNDIGHLSITTTLPSGYHEVIFEAAGEAQATGVWCPPPGEPPPDGFLSIDTALSWLAKPETRPALVANLRHVIGTGGLARERLSWAAIRPTEARPEWETARNRSYETTRRLYVAAGVPVLEMFHDAPAWMGRAQKGKFPDDLVAASRAWRDVALRWHDLWGALEVWNEPDIAFGGNQPSDQYAPLVKTIRRAMRDAVVDTPVGGGVFASLNPAYLELAARNGLLDECDFLSFHYYGNPLGLERLVGQYRGWLATSGYATKPLWMTEVGLSRPGKTGVRPPIKEQAATALAYAMQAVEARACGVARFFPFVYVDYSEHDDSRHFGMLDRNGSPLRMLAASAQAGRALAGMEYAGDIPAATVPGAERIRVFVADGKKSVATGNEQTALVVIYTGKAVAAATTTATAADAEVTLPFVALSAQGIDGRSLPLKTGAKKAPAGDGLVYLRVARASLADSLKTDTEAMRLYQLGKAAAPVLPPVASIVLQPRIDPEKMQAISSRGYFLPAGCEHLPVTVGVNNLGDEARTVTLRADGATGTSVTIPGGKHEQVTLDVKIAALPAGVTGDDRLLSITATADDGSRIGPAALTLIPSLGEGDIAAHLKTSAYHFALTAGEAYRWDRNANGTVTFAHGPPAAWGFTIKFPPGVDRWAYPRFTLPQEVAQSRITGVLVRARCLKPAIVRLMSWNDDGEMSVTHFPIIPADGEWHVTYVPLASYQGFSVVDPGTIRIAKLSVGFNSQTDENALEISDLYVIGK
ncbi:MAG: glycoside hydrolase family protein [Opitutaceae bacterium]|nr:glycoside hydrolase family protein [Opitutaceae bacterium]